MEGSYALLAPPASRSRERAGDGAIEPAKPRALVKRRGLGLVVVVGSLLFTSSRAGAQMRAPGTTGNDFVGVGYGTWHLSDDIPKDEQDRKGWSSGLYGPKAVLEVVYARPSGNAPGILGVLAYRPQTRTAGILSASLGLGFGAIDYRYSDQRAENIAACNSTPGCLWEGGSLETGWGTVAVAKVWAALTVGPVSAGPWATGFLKLLGANVHAGRKGPTGYGLEAKVRF
jgi:hypothetical protein